MGAPAALLYAAQYPDEVLSLTYLEEPVLLTNNERYHLHLSSIHQIAALKLRSKYCFACGMALHERCGSCNELLVSLKFRCCPYCGTTYKSSK